MSFTSGAPNLVAGDTNGTYDVFVRDRRTGSTERVNGSDAGAQANGSSFAGAISADGRFVSFASSADNLVGGDTNNTEDAFVRNRSATT